MSRRPAHGAAAVALALLLALPAARSAAATNAMPTHPAAATAIATNAMSTNTISTSVTATNATAAAKPPASVESFLKFPVAPTNVRTAVTGATATAWMEVRSISNLATLAGTGMTNFIAAATNRADADVLLTSPAKKTMYEALFNVQDKEYEKAIPKLERVLGEDPTLLAAWEALGWSYWNLGRRDDARTLWERLQSLDPRQPMSYNLLAQVATAQGNLEKAGDLLAKSLDLNPDQYEIRFWLAENMLWRGMPDQAAPRLARLLEEDTGRLDVRLELARALTANQQYEEALDHWSKINEEVPDNPEYLVPEGQCLLYIGEVRHAETNALHALELAPDNLQAINLLADIAELTREPAQGIAALRSLIDRTDNKVYRCRLWFRLANLQKAMYDRDALAFPLAPAIASARQGTDDDPRYVPGWLFLAELHMANHAYDDAEDVFHKVLKDMNPQNLRAQQGLIECDMATSRYDDCERQILNTYRAFDPFDPYRHLYLARLEFARGNYAESMRELDMLEQEGLRGAVFCPVYTALSTSEWEPATSTRRFRDHLLALKRAGFQFMSADRLPAYFASRKSPETPSTKPWLYRVIRTIETNVTGKDPVAGPDLSLYSPDKIACVTFDGARRTTFRLGTPVAEEFNIPMSVNVAAGDVQKGRLGLASWDDLKQAVTSGWWVVGSLLMDPETKPVDKDGYLDAALPNRTWDVAHSRLETMRAWFLRVRREFRDSRKLLLQKLGLDEDAVKFVAYPSGDIGQQADSNVAEIENVVETILNEAYMNYSLGFVQSTFGFACAVDNPYLYQRYAPSRTANGPDIVRQAFENHPVFLARRMRAEIAALQGKPYLANKMLAALQRDGYPDDSLRKLSQYVRERLANQIAATPQQERTEHSVKSKQGLELSHPYVGVEGHDLRANQQITLDYVGAKAGLNLTPHLSAEIEYDTGYIKQTISSNLFFQTNITVVTHSRQVKSETQNGVTTDTDTDTTSYDDQTVFTNRTLKNTYRSNLQTLRARVDYRFTDGSVFTANAGERTFKAQLPDSATGDEPLFGGSFQWRPFFAVDTVLAYQHDTVPSAREVIGYDSGAVFLAYRAADWWDLSGRGQYSQFSDANSMLQMKGESMWLVSEDANLSLGIEAALITVDQASPYYWSPYWEQRYYAVARIVRSMPLFYASAEFKIGEVHDKARQEDVDAYNALAVQGANEKFYPGPNPQGGWDVSVGLSGSLRRRVGRHWEIFGDANITFLNAYAEHDLGAGAIYHF